MALANKQNWIIGAIIAPPIMAGYAYSKIRRNQIKNPLLNLIFILGISFLIYLAGGIIWIVIAIPVGRLMVEIGLPTENIIYLYPPILWGFSALITNYCWKKLPTKQ